MPSDSLSKSLLESSTEVCYLPVETERLMRIARMKVWAAEAGVVSIKEKQQVVSITLSEEGTKQADGAKIVEQSMMFGRAVGFGMEGTQLILTVDYHKCGNHLPFDVVEKMMEK